MRLGETWDTRCLTLGTGTSFVVKVYLFIAPASIRCQGNGVGKNGQIPCLRGAQTLKVNTVLSGGKGLGALMPIIGEFKVRKSFSSKPTHELKSERRVD